MSWCKHTEKLRNYLKRNLLSIYGDQNFESMLVVYCRHCEDQYDVRS